MNPEVVVHTVIIYETVYGNTLDIAATLAHVAQEYGQTDLVSAKEATATTHRGADLLFVGAPTHVHGLPRLSTRATPTTPDPLPGLREWFDTLGPDQAVSAVAFDTRLAGPELLTGRASHAISRRLHSYGFKEVAAPRSFLVDKHNALLTDEQDRAHQWARLVYDSLTSDQSMPHL